MGSGSLGTGLIGGVLGAFLGAGAMLAVGPAAPSHEPSPGPAALEAAFERALAPVVAELRAAGTAPTTESSRPRVRVDDRGSATAEPAQPAPIEGGTRSLPDDLGAEPGVPLRDEGAIWIPPPNIERVRELAGFEENVRVRQRWLFLSEREALAQFGTPDLVYGDGGGEKWEYEDDYIDEDGDTASRTYTLIFNRGRLVQFFD